MFKLVYLFLNFFVRAIKIFVYSDENFINFYHVRYVKNNKNFSIFYDKIIKKSKLEYKEYD